MIGHPLLQHIAERINHLVRQCPPPGTDLGLLVGFSGGPDSLALLLGANLWAQQGPNRTVEAAHLHHELRPGAADEDLAFCRRRCADLGLVLHESRQDPRPVANRRGLGLEEAGRYLRHGFMQNLLEKNDHLHCLSLGHHRDDQVETILMRLFRGTGPQGMTGIPAVRNNVIRPMLDLPRRDITACLEEIGESWCVDISNLKGDNLRARLRREVIPVLDGVFGPGAHAQPLYLAQLMAQDLGFLENLTSQALATVCVPGQPERIYRDKLLALEPALAGRVLHNWLTKELAQDLPRSGKGPAVPDSMGRVHIQAALTWLATGQSGTWLDLPGGFRLERAFQEITVVKTGLGHPHLRNAADYRIDVKVAPAVGNPSTLGLEEKNGVAIPGGWRLSCPAKALKGNLRVDHFQPGDKIMPLGLEGSKKLSDLFREHRVPVDQRSGILVVRDEESILWVVGLARSERTRLLPRADKIVTISVIERSHES